MRADALRNQVRILDAARSQLAEAGADVSMDQIAKAAGVAVGTLYRHYPTKGDLVRAVLIELSESLIRRAREAVDSLTGPGDALREIERMLADYLDEAATNQAVKTAANVFDASYLDPDSVQAGRDAVDAIVALAIADGDLRPEVTTDDVFLVMSSVPTLLPDDARARWLEIVLAGLRA